MIRRRAHEQCWLLTLAERVGPDQLILGLLDDPTSKAPGRSR